MPPQYFVAAPPFALFETMASKTELEVRVATLRCEEAALKAQVKMAQLKMVSVSAAPRLRPCTPYAWGIALRLHALVGDAQIAVQYLQKQCRCGDESEIRASFASLSAETRASLLCPSPADKQATRQVAEAQKFLKERQLSLWVRVQNTTKGIAPTSAAILEQAGADFAQGGVPQNRCRWVRHFMKRWSGRRGRFPRGQRLSPEEFRAKVGLGS